MPGGEQSHLSIGEVLSLLQEEFPDVTISKIRFLESQGLLDPERTPSGYRKFYEPDVDRLRWILGQQRDHFLPLKVIKERLDVGPGREWPSDDGDASARPDVDSHAAEAEAWSDEVDEETASVHTEPPDERPAGLTATRPGPPRAEVAMAVDDPAPAPEPRPVDNVLDAGPTEISMTPEELRSAVGLAESELAELERFGLLTSRQVGADRYYDGDAMVVARAAAAFRRHGVEARHLRMYKVSAEREAGFLEQVIMPLLKQRNPAARQRAIETVAELAGLGQQLHAALLRRALDDELG